MEQAGCISFARFMELALYCPVFGYYERESRVVGRGGDFFTSVSTGGLFGELLAFQFAQWLEEYLPQDRISMVEAGAHDGQLAVDILTWLQTNRPSLFERINYCLIEPSSRRQAWQGQKLEKFAGQIRWVESLAALAPEGVRGVIFSNELLDALPVHHVAWNARDRSWLEWGVAEDRGRFIWRRMTGRDWRNELLSAGFVLSAELESVLPDGFTIDLSLAAAKWWRDAASVLRQGWLVTSDYGLTADQLLVPERRNGTLRAFRDHRASLDLLANPGHQDLTAHVNFSHVQAAGESIGLKTQNFSTQSQFLTRIAGQIWGQGVVPTPDEVRQFQTLSHPEHLGRPFRVLVQSRDR